PHPFSTIFSAAASTGLRWRRPSMRRCGVRDTQRRRPEGRATELSGPGVVAERGTPASSRLVRYTSVALLELPYSRIQRYHNTLPRRLLAASPSTLKTISSAPLRYATFSERGLASARPPDGAGTVGGASDGPAVRYSSVARVIG